MALYEIPLNTGNQKFNVQLNKTTYKLQLIYRSKHWYLDVLDSSSKPIVSALPMISGVDLLEQHQHLIKGSLFVINSNKDESHGFQDLGTKIQLFWSDAA